MFQVAQVPLPVVSRKLQGFPPPTSAPAHQFENFWMFFSYVVVGPVLMLGRALFQRVNPPGPQAPNI